jgi:hypothetical protein
MFTKPRRMSVVDRVGERHGRLVVTSRAENKIEPSGAVRAQWECVCDCGNKLVTSGQSLGRGSTKSCGCITKEMRKDDATHGKSRSEEYRIWSNMKQRCTNPKSTHFASYGGRGITLCPAWHLFENFHRDVGDRPKDATLERVDNEKGYEPGNVIWASRLVQASNRRTNTLITFNGETRTLTGWGHYTGFGKSVIIGRLDHGWTVDRALTEPLQNTGKRRRKLNLL